MTPIIDILTYGMFAWNGYGGLNHVAPSSALQGRRRTRGIWRLLE